MCIAQDHLKRMLAFATIVYVGIFLIGLGTLNEDGVAGAALFVVSDGANKAALFGAVGILQHRKADVSERGLRGAGHAGDYVAVIGARDGGGRRRAGARRGLSGLTRLRLRSGSGRSSSPRRAVAARRRR